MFGSPHRLNLRLLCMNGRLLKPPDIWPQLPIVIHVDDRETCLPLPGVTNVISMLKQNDRVCKIVIDNVPSPLFEEVAAMAEPFPALIALELTSYKEEPPTLPDSFLGGSAPRLQSLHLYGISFPGVGRLILSTHDLVDLSLGSIPNSGYVSPEAMVNILSALTKLEFLLLSFRTPPFGTHEVSQRPPGPTRVILPALTHFDYYGSTGHLGDIVSRIDAPLDCLSIVVTHCDQGQLPFDILLLRDFIWRTKLLNSPYRADIFFTVYNSRVSIFQRKEGVDFQALNFVNSYLASDSQLSGLAQACSSLLLPLPSLECLRLDMYKAESEHWSIPWQDVVESAQWMELLRPFITVRDLVLADPVVLSVASALEELVGEQGTEILPLLQTIFLEGFQSSSPVPEGIVKFIAARELYGRSVIVRRQERESRESSWRG